jgi:RNA polymerase sigma-70 factor (ECF subfamily)
MQQTPTTAADADPPLSADEMRLFHAGDAHFLSTLISRHTRRLSSDARRYAACDDEAADLVQETWIRVYEKRGSFRGDGALYGWIRSVLASVALSRRRTEVRREAQVHHVTQAVLGDAPAAFDDAMGDAEEDLGHGLRLVEALMRLPRRQREMVILRFMGGYSTEKIAAAMECAPGTVKATVAHGVKRLRKELKEL